MMRPRRGHVRQDQQERRASSKRETPVAAAGSARPRTVVAGIGPTTSASGGTNERTDGVPVLPVSGDGRVEPDHDGDKHPQIVPHTQIPMQPEAPPPTGLSHMTFSKLGQEAAQELVIPPGSLELSLHRAFGALQLRQIEGQSA